MDEKERYEQARKRVEEIKGFYVHLLVYVLVNLGLFLVNILRSPETIWFYWPLLGWGFGVVAHGISVFGLRGVLGPEWEKRKIREIMSKE
ncbi:MAG: histidine kinase [Latescibacteria bacterium DG_63]|uniref:Histidine kinase n=2 Tax=Bacteria division TA06 TaxID=1156500 RepID=A0A0S8JPW4_UNCT6|nr:MAG: histidine kinase [Latescibacteria bacterium DG_63]KPK69675.1 MAG: histidine kinase [candidate division TA06 bacterium SM23_40]KPL10654.1 MAG: histidine kinase [candidate division TA06 bacterium SM1_40]